MDPQKATLAITEYGTLIVILGTIAAADAIKIQKIRELGPDEAANITALADTAVSTADATMNAINAWRTAHQLPPLQKP